MKTSLCKITKRGQISVPASIRKDMGLRPGQRLRWEKISSSECRVFLEPKSPQGPVAALGFAAKLRGGKSKRTSAWMRELREGE